MIAGCARFQGVAAVTSEQQDEVLVINVDEEKTKVGSDRSKRNDFQMLVIRKSNIACNKYTRRLSQFDIGRNLFFKSVSIISGSVAPILSGTGTEALAVLSGTSTAINAEITADVFQNQMFVLVHKAIGNARKEKLQEIRAKHSQSVADYGVEDSLTDADQYHALCSLRTGIGRLVEQNEIVQPSKEELNTEKTAILERITTLRGQRNAAGITQRDKALVDRLLNQEIVRLEQVRALLPFAK